MTFPKPLSTCYFKIGFREGFKMRAFLAAIVAAAVIAVVGGVVLGKFQEPVSEAYSTVGVRL